MRCIISGTEFRSDNVKIEYNKIVHQYGVRILRVGQERAAPRKMGYPNTLGRRSDGKANGSPMDLLYSYTNNSNGVGGWDKKNYEKD